MDASLLHTDVRGRDEPSGKEVEIPVWLLTFDQCNAMEFSTVLDYVCLPAMPVPIHIRWFEDYAMGPNKHTCASFLSESGSSKVGVHVA